MPLTLAEYEQTLENPLEKGVILGLRMESVIADILRWSATGSLSVDGVRFDSVPEPAYTAINATIQEDTVRGKPISFGVYKILHHIDIDTALENDSNSIESQSGRQIRMAMKGAAYVMNDRYVNGDRGADPNGPDGVNIISQSLDASQTVNPAAQIDISGTVTLAVANQFIDLIDEAHDAMEGHLPTFALANRQFLLRTKSVLRQAGFLGDHFDWIRENFPTTAPRETERTAAARPHFVYDNVPYYDIGVQADQTTQIIGNVFQDVTAADETRVFYTKLGPDDFEGLVGEMVNITPIGMLEDKDSERWRLRGQHGWAAWGPRSLVRMGGVKVA